MLLEKQWQNSLVPLPEQSLTRSQGAGHVAGTRSVAAPVKAGQKCPVPEEQQCLSRVGCCRAGRGVHRQTDSQTASKQEQLIPQAQPLLRTGYIRGLGLCGEVQCQVSSELTHLCRVCGNAGGGSVVLKAHPRQQQVQLLCLCAVLVLNWGVSPAAVSAPLRAVPGGLRHCPGGAEPQGRARHGVGTGTELWQGLPKGSSHPALSGCL